MKRWAAALMVILACGKDGLDSGLPADKPGGELQPMEQTSLCDAVSDYFDAKLGADGWTRYMCTLDAFGDAAEMGGGDTQKAIAACNQLRDACVKSGAEDDFEFSCSETSDLSMCSATVGEIERCYEDAIDQLGALVADFTCEILDPEVALELQEKYGDAMTDPLPPSCDAVEQKCPGLFGEEDAAEGSSQAGVRRLRWSIR